MCDGCSRQVSFHRPHSPYDPPQRFIDRTPLSSLRPVYTCGKDDPLGWDSVFSDNSNGCGPQNLDAWCGAMPVGLNGTPFCWASDL
jgi:hypothetical protein